MGNLCLGILGIHFHAYLGVSAGHVKMFTGILSSKFMPIGIIIVEKGVCSYIWLGKGQQASEWIFVPCYEIPHTASNEVMNLMF